jgi:NAD-reducing hydrogenase small subunit
VETESTDSSGKIPDDPELCIPTKVRAVQDVVPVDIFVPGCPPDADTIFYVLSELAQGRRPDLKDDKLQWN